MTMNNASDDLTLAIARSAYTACRCDFCTGKKRWDDNWCARCGEVQMQPPKWWENCDVCDSCEVQMDREIAEEQAARLPETP